MQQTHIPGEGDMYRLWATKAGWEAKDEMKAHCPHLFEKYVQCIFPGLSFLLGGCNTLSLHQV